MVYFTSYSKSLVILTFRILYRQLLGLFSDASISRFVEHMKGYNNADFRALSKNAQVFPLARKR